MNWIKKGKLFSPTGNFGWINSYAQVPAALVLEEEKIVRVYFSTRPVQGKTLTTFVDFDLNDISKIVNVNEKPILNLGEPGTFDEHGIMPSCVVRTGDEVFLYYSGWQQSVGVPYNNYTGLAISKDKGLTFEKYSETPILDRRIGEPFSATSPFVLKEDGKWHMWYCSGTNWHFLNDKFEHTYNIKYAHSLNGKEWTQTGIVSIPQIDSYEAITKPTVVKINEQYHMWYCYRGSKNFRGGTDSYRMGYATSVDLLKWKREDEAAGISVSDSDWDSEMIAYPDVFKLKEELLMLYNGNAFGKEGFGYAILKK